MNGFFSYQKKSQDLIPLKRFGFNEIIQIDQDCVCVFSTFTTITVFLVSFPKSYHFRFLNNSQKQNIPFFQKFQIIIILMSFFGATYSNKLHAEKWWNFFALEFHRYCFFFSKTKNFSIIFPPFLVWFFHPWFDNNDYKCNKVKCSN